MIKSGVLVTRMHFIRINNWLQNEAAKINKIMQRAYNIDVDMLYHPHDSRLLLMQC